MLSRGAAAMANKGVGREQLVLSGRIACDLTTGDPPPQSDILPIDSARAKCQLLTFLGSPFPLRPPSVDGDWRLA